MFRKIFNSYDPPLSTYIPKKDLCSICKQYKESTAEERLKRKQTYDAHKKREKEALDIKKADITSLNSSQMTDTFDLQAILTLPFAGDSKIYYKRKLSMYNVTVYTSAGEGHCYVWDETYAKKGLALAL